MSGDFSSPYSLFTMAASRIWQYGALAVVVLAAMILTTPASNAANTAPVVTEKTRIEEMRVLVTWGDVDSNVGTVGTGATMTWDGHISMQSGNMVVLRQLFFKDPNDRLITESGTTISYQSDINSDMDGLFLRVFPDNGRTDTITVTLDNGVTVTQPLLGLLTQKDVTFPVSDGLSIRMQAQGEVLSQGDIRDQAARKMADLLKRCTDSGKTEADCQKLLAETAKSEERNKRLKIWDALNREAGKLKDSVWAGKAIHPDVLFLLGEDQLEKLTREDLSRMDLSKLSHMTDAVYKTILRLAPERLNTLPSDLRDAGLVLEGVLPDNVRTAGNLTAEQFQNMKRFLASLDETERESFSKLLATLSPSAWDSVKNLNDDMLLSLGRLMISVPEAKRDVVLKAYLRQATKISNLEIKLEQLRSRLSVTDAQRLEDMLTRLKGMLIWTGDETPMVLTAIDGFLGRSGGLQREDFAKQLNALEKDVQQAIAENNVGLQKENFGLFTDVSTGSWYAGFVGMMRSEGLLSGYKDKQGKDTGTFGPENPVTVAELLKIALETSGQGPSGSGTTMVTAAAGHWAKGYVVRAEELHMSIVADPKVDLNRPATRGEVIQAFIEAFGINPADISKSSFSDVYANMTTARFIEFAKNHDIISGDDGKTTFRPTEKINRAEVAKIGIRIKQILRSLFDKSTVEGDLAN